MGTKLAINAIRNITPLLKIANNLEERKGRTLRQDKYVQENPTDWTWICTLIMIKKYSLNDSILYKDDFDNSIIGKGIYIKKIRNRVAWVGAYIK